jgi:hypothetical protein
MRFGSLIPVTLFLAGCGAAPVQDIDSRTQPAPRTTPTALREAAHAITASDMYQRIGVLAHDSLRGRDTPSPGLESAARYIVREFQALGLEAAGEDGSYYQRYPYPQRALGTDGVRLEIAGGGGPVQLARGTDFYATGGAPDLVTGGLVFLGSAGALDPPANSLRERVAIAYLPGAPTGDWRRDATRAQRLAGAAGAGALLLVLDPGFPEDQFVRLARQAELPRRTLGAEAPMPVHYVRYQPASALFRAADLDLDALRTRALRGAIDPVELPGVTGTVGAPLHTLDDARPPNVAAVLRGSDPELRDTYVVFSAHMDHIGVGQPDARGDSINNGADDNASGTAALLAMAQAFASLPQAPRRSVIFLAVSGEEKGLLGSRWFADNPTVPLESMVANVNMDMIGRGGRDTVVVIGKEYSSLGPLVRRVAADYPEIGLTVSPDIWPGQRFFFRSDHFNFARKEIPSLFFFTGVHEDYHRPSDTVEKIDTEKAARVARLAFLTAWEIAMDPSAPEWTPEGLAEVRALTR